MDSSDAVAAPPATESSSSAARGRRLLILAALGVVYGDIGTSPLYALRACFEGRHAIPATTANVIGAVSLIFWFLVIIVSIKYVIFVLRADNKGEGGILALMALVHRIGPERIRQLALIPFLGILGAGLLFSDSVITPAISVLSAIEGLEVATPFFGPLVVPLSLLILAGLFALQWRGTTTIGSLFGPVMLVWFLTIGILGIVAIFRFPSILQAVNPWHAVSLLAATGWKGLSLLGTAFLAVTGAEVLYADMGHFGKSPIRTAWFVIVFPALILNYMGQGAILLGPNALPANLFYALAPRWFLYPLVIIATAATVIASQAVISGAFSLARQAVQLGFWPRIRIVHTSSHNIGQVYIPFINITLFVAVCILIVLFEESGRLASAYGIAVSATMLVTTVLILLVARALWRMPFVVIAPIGLLLLLLDAALLTSNLAKLVSGGWIVILLAAAVCTLMTTWVAGRRLMQKQVFDASLPIEAFAADLAKQTLVRFPRTAVFLSGNAESTPRALLHNYKHNGVVHARTVIVSVTTAETPSVAPADRYVVRSLGAGLYTVVLRYGFMESPDVPKALASIESVDFSRDLLQLSYFLGKESLVLTAAKTMPGWRKQIFHFMTRNAQPASAFFRLPPNRVVELGGQIEF